MLVPERMKQRAFLDNIGIDKKQQREIYMITSGAATLNIVKDGKTIMMKNV